MLAYFAEAEHEQHFGTELGGCPACGTTRPEFIFDVLETPLRDLSGDIIYEENSQGQLVPGAPLFARLLAGQIRKLPPAPGREAGQPAQSRPPPPRRSPCRPQPPAQRNRSAGATNGRNCARCSAAPSCPSCATAATCSSPCSSRRCSPLLIGWALYFTDDATGKYDFASAFHIPTYIFIALLVALFLALMNTVDDIIRDRVDPPSRAESRRAAAVLHLREIRHAGRFSPRCSARSSSLVGNEILEIRGMFWPILRLHVHHCGERHCARPGHFARIVADRKTAANFVPLVLIPQLIFGGALIKYEDMNKDLDVIYTFKRWFSTHPEIAAAGDATTIRN